MFFSFSVVLVSRVPSSLFVNKSNKFDNLMSDSERTVSETEANAIPSNTNNRIRSKTRPKRNKGLC